MQNEEEPVGRGNDVCNERVQGGRGWRTWDGQRWWRALIKILHFDNVVVGEYAKSLIVVNPGKGPEFIVELGKGGKMKIVEVTFREEVTRNAEWLRRSETVDAGFLVWAFADGAIELAVPAVGGVGGQKGMSSGG